MFGISLVFLTIIFHKVVYKRSCGVVQYIVIILLHIVCKVPCFVVTHGV